MFNWHLYRISYLIWKLTGYFYYSLLVDILFFPSGIFLFIYTIPGKNTPFLWIGLWVNYKTNTKKEPTWEAKKCTKMVYVNNREICCSMLFYVLLHRVLTLHIILPINNGLFVISISFLKYIQALMEIVTFSCLKC